MSGGEVDKDKDEEGSYCSRCFVIIALISLFFDLARHTFVLITIYANPYFE